MSTQKNQIPIIKWAQRKDRLFITINVVHSKKPILDLTDGKKLKYQGTDGTINYAFELEFYEEILKEGSKYTLDARNVFLNLQKKNPGPYWPRLIKDKKKYHWIEVDWLYFTEEDEENESKQPIKPGQDFDDMPDMAEMDEANEHNHDHNLNHNDNEENKKEEIKEEKKVEIKEEKKEEIKEEKKVEIKEEKKEESSHNKKININTPFEQFIEYKEDSNGTITSPLLNSLRNWNSNNFNDYSIFETNQELFKDDIKYIQDLIINYINTKKLSVKLNNLESGSIGSMLGMAIADAMGHRFEFEPVRYNEITLRDMGEGPGGKFQLLPGQWTDDTSMGLCLADSLIMNKGEYDAHDLMHRFLSWWYCGYNNAFRFDNSRSGSVGLGGQINGSFMYYINNPKKLTIYGDINSSGIGSIMRNGAVPICYHDNIEKGMEVAKLQSYLTHQGNEAAECCRLLTYIITKILNRKGEEKLIDIISNLEKFETPVNSVKCLALSQKESEDPNRNWNWKDKDFRYSPKRSESQPGYIGSYAMDGMAMALHVIYYTNTFEDAIIKVVNLRGDSDSVGAVVGQIAGAYYGLENIPPDWIKAVSQWDNYEIPLRGYILQKLNKMKL